MGDGGGGIPCWLVSQTEPSEEYNATSSSGPRVIRARDPPGSADVLLVAAAVVPAGVVPASAVPPAVLPVAVSVVVLAVAEVVVVIVVCKVDGVGTWVPAFKLLFCTLKYACIFLCRKKRRNTTNYEIPPHLTVECLVHLPLFPVAGQASPLPGGGKAEPAGIALALVLEVEVALAP